MGCLETGWKREIGSNEDNKYPQLAQTEATFDIPGQPAQTIAICGRSQPRQLPDAEKVAHIESAMGCLETGWEKRDPEIPYTLAALSYDPEPTTSSDLTERAERDLAIMEVYTTVIVTSTYNIDEPYTPTNFSYHPVTNEPSSGRQINLTTTSLKRDLDVDATPLIVFDGTIGPQERPTTDTITGETLNRATCTPVVSLGSEKGAQADSVVGCAVPQNVDITKSEYIVVASTTMTIDGSEISVGPQVTGTGMRVFGVGDLEQDGVQRMESSASRLPLFFGLVVATGSAFVMGLMIGFVAGIVTFIKSF